MAKNILIADDDYGSRSLIKLQLRKVPDYTLLEATNISEAENILKKNSIACALIDLTLGSESGLDLVKNIRANENSTHLPIIALTAHVGRNVEDNCFQAGCNEYLSKPYKVPDLLRVIQKYAVDQN